MVRWRSRLGFLRTSRGNFRFQNPCWRFPHIHQTPKTQRFFSRTATPFEQKQYLNLKSHIGLNSKAEQQNNQHRYENQHGSYIHILFYTPYKQIICTMRWYGMIFPNHLPLKKINLSRTWATSTMTTMSPFPGQPVLWIQNDKSHRKHWKKTSPIWPIAKKKHRNGWIWDSSFKFDAKWMILVDLQDINFVFLNSEIHQTTSSRKATSWHVWSCPWSTAVSPSRSGRAVRWVWKRLMG